MRSALLWLAVLFFFFVPAGLAQQYPFLLVPNSPLRSGGLFEDRQGRLWMVSDGTVKCFDGSRTFSLHALGLPDSITRTIGSVFAEDGDGGIWFVSGVGVYRFQKGRLECVVGGSAESVVRAPDLMLVDYRLCWQLYKGLWVGHRFSSWT